MTVLLSKRRLHQPGALEEILGDLLGFELARLVALVKLIFAECGDRNRKGPVAVGMLWVAVAGAFVALDALSENLDGAPREEPAPFDRAFVELEDADAMGRLALDDDEPVMLGALARDDLAAVEIPSGAKMVSQPEGGPGPFARIRGVLRFQIRHVGEAVAQPVGPRLARDLCLGIAPQQRLFGLPCGEGFGCERVR